MSPCVLQEIAPQLVEAMILDQDGLVLCDSSQLHNNTAVNTRSQGNGKPYPLRMNSTRVILDFAVILKPEFCAYYVLLHLL